MIHLVLDTNILHQEGLNSGKMQILKKLTDSDHVKVYIPEIVKNEFITKRVSEIKDSLNKSISSLKDLDRKIEINKDIKDTIKITEKTIKSLLDHTPETVSGEYDTWKKEYKVRTLFFSNEKMNNVMNDYFSGSGVFTAIKSRKDIPDAMIHTQIEELAETLDEVTVLIKDGAFKKCLESNDKIKSYNSLTEFFKIDAVEALKSKIQAVEDIIEHIKSSDYSEALKDYFIENEEIINEIYISDGGVENTQLLCSRLYAAEINFPWGSDVEDIKIENVFSLTTEKYIADISFTTKAAVHFVTDYGSYLEIDKNRSVDMDSMNGDGMCDLYEFYTANFSGRIEIQFSSIQPGTEFKTDEDFEDFLEIADIGLEIDVARLVPHAA